MQLNRLDSSFTNCERTLQIAIGWRDGIARDEASSRLTNWVAFVRQRESRNSVRRRCTKHLKTLESEFGARIYQKKERHLALTEAGRVVLPFMKEALLHHDAAFTAMAGARRARFGPCGRGAEFQQSPAASAGEAVPEEIPEGRRFRRDRGQRPPDFAFAIRSAGFVV